MDQEERKFLTTEGIVLGFILGLVLIVVAYYAHADHRHIISNPVTETFFVAVYLTALVAFCGFKLPTFFVKKHPRFAAFFLPFFCGHISLLFDSFAVVLLLTGLTFVPWTSKKNGHRHKFNAFAFKVICAFNALTVGGALYLGELWGLPHYIASGKDHITAGFPLLVVLTPYSVITSLIAAYKYPVKVEPVVFDRMMVKSGLKFLAGLIGLVVTHDVLFCLGCFLLFTALTGRTVRLANKFLHELSEGAFVAVGLIVVVMLVQMIPGTKQWFAENFFGWRIMALSALSSPFAGAAIPPAQGVDQFFANLSWLMCGAPIFVFSSLVAIIVFKDTIDYEDLPAWMKRIAFKKEGVMQEALAYTLLVFPLTLGLGLMLAVANHFRVFGTLYRMMH